MGIAWSDSDGRDVSATRCEAGDAGCVADQEEKSAVDAAAGGSSFLRPNLNQEVQPLRRARSVVEPSARRTPGELFGEIGVAGVPGMLGVVGVVERGAGCTAVASGINTDKDVLAMGAGALCFVPATSMLGEAGLDESTDVAAEAVEKLSRAEAGWQAASILWLGAGLACEIAS